MSDNKTKNVPAKKSFYEYSPDKMEDKNLPKNFLDFSRGQNFSAYEMISGVNFILVVDDDIIIHADKKTNEMVELFNGTLIKPLSRLVQHFGDGVEFTLYGTYLSHEDSVVDYVGPPKIFFYDMYMNSNWIRNDDFEELFNKFGLPTAPPIQTGTMNNNFIKYVNHAIDSVSNIDGLNGVYGVYFKSLNGIGQHRSIKKGAYTFYNEKYRKNKSTISASQEKEAKEKVEEVAYFTLNKEMFDKWDVILKSRNIEKNKNNLGKIMPIVMGDYLAYHTEEREFLALELNMSESDTEKLMRKYISKIIVAKYF